MSSSLGRRISTPALFSGKRAEGLAGEPVHGPLRVWFRAEALVKPDRAFVPVEDGPLEPAAIAFDRDPRQSFQQRPPDAGAPVLGLDEQVLEVDPGLGEEGREVV